MATYKVIQDIEAEDKFLGPLTIKQFIFGMIGMFFGYLNFFALTKGATVLMAVFLPPMLLGFFLAIPWSKEQSTEVWVLAKLRFRFKPKKRIWDQSGMEQLVTITAPKKIEKVLTNGLEQDEVKSRLRALAETIDSRGWAVKHAALEEALSPTKIITDRLVNPAEVYPQEVPAVDVASMHDVLDSDTKVSNDFDSMISQSQQTRMQQNLDKMDRVRAGEPIETIRQPEVRFTPPPQPYAGSAQQVAAMDEKLLTETLRAKRAASDNSLSNMHGINTYDPYIPGSSQPLRRPDNNKAQAAMSEPAAPAIIEQLARDNDKNLETLSRMAKPKQADDDNEVVISLR